MRACPRLENLALDQNRIQSVEELHPLNELPEIEHVEIRGNPVCFIENYRSKIF